MTRAPGRTYRYYTKQPLFPFGFGLSYTTFNFTATIDYNRQSHDSSISVTIKNTGKVDGDEIIQIYHRVSDALRNQLKSQFPIPAKNLVEFGRYSVAAGAQTTANFVLPGSRALTLTNQLGNQALFAGVHYFDITNSISTQTLTVNLDVSRVLEDNPLPDMM